jgi:hypothetical protein
MESVIDNRVARELDRRLSASPPMALVLLVAPDSAALERAAEYAAARRVPARLSVGREPSAALREVLPAERPAQTRACLAGARAPSCAGDRVAC